MSRNQEYIKFYRLSEEILKDLIPHLEDEEIIQFISSRGWLIIPTSFERDKRASINRPDPNIFISLNGDLSLGIHCNTMESVRRLRNILLGFYINEKNKLLHALQELDERFTTNVERKVKEHHFSESPSYETVFEIASNKVDEGAFHTMFRMVDEILQEGEQRMREKNQRWRAVAPVINIARLDIASDEPSFKEALGKLKPIYGIVLDIGTPDQIRAQVRKGKAKCPDCGARLSLERETGTIYCSNCGYIFAEEQPTF